MLVLDRFDGGGATALSGGVVYAGGGTPQQRAAGVSDSAEAMFGYLRTEVGDVVPAGTLREFCDGSAAMLAWLEGHGVPFEGSLCPDKTSYPTNRHYLYYSGSEVSARDIAPPAPRGHRARGRGTSGGLLYARLAAAVRRAGIQVVAQTSGRAADHRRRAGDGGGVPFTARRAASGRGRRTDWRTGLRSSPTCTCRSSAGSCTGRPTGWSAGTGERCSSVRAAAW